MAISSELRIPAARAAPDPSPATVFVPSHPPRGAVTMLARARREFGEARTLSRADDRFLAAYRAAAHAASGVVLARSVLGGPSRPNSVWTSLAEHAPELRDWARYFTEASRWHNVAEAGLPGRITTGYAEEFVGRLGEFIALTERAVGVGRG